MIIPARDYIDTLFLCVLSICTICAFSIVLFVLLEMHDIRKISTKTR